MRQLSRIAGGAALSAAIAAAIVFVVPGCVDQNQDNSPISINNSSGRPALSVTCSQDGSVAYVTDGRNVYRYERLAPGEGDSWECILSYGERLEMAAKHDLREQSILDSFREQIPDAKSDPTRSESKSK